MMMMKIYNDDADVDDEDDNDEDYNCQFQCH